MMQKSWLLAFWVFALITIGLGAADRNGTAVAQDGCVLEYGQAAAGNLEVTCTFEGQAGDRVTAIMDIPAADNGSTYFNFYAEDGSTVPYEGFFPSIYTLPATGTYVLYASFDGGYEEEVTGFCGVYNPDGSCQQYIEEVETFDLPDTFVIQLVLVPPGMSFSEAAATLPDRYDAVVFPNASASGGSSAPPSTGAGSTNTGQGIPLTFDFLTWAFSGFAAVSLEAYSDSPFASDGALPTAASGRCEDGTVEVTLAVEELVVTDPEEADTTSFIGGDEAFLLYGIGLLSNGEPDFGVDNEYLYYYSGDLYTDSVMSSFDTLTRQVPCDQVGFVNFALFEDDSGLFGTSYIALGQPVIVPLVSEENPTGTFPASTTLRFYGRSTDGTYDYALTFTLTLSGDPAALAPADSNPVPTAPDTATAPPADTPTGDTEDVFALVPEGALPLEAGTLESPGNFDYLLTRDQAPPPTALILRAGEIYTTAFTVNEADGAAYYSVTDAATGDPVPGAMTVLYPDMAQVREFNRISVEQDTVWVYDFYLDEYSADVASFTLEFWSEGQVADYLIEVGVPVTLDAPEVVDSFGVTFPRYFIADGVTAYTVSVSDMAGAPVLVPGFYPVVNCGPTEFYSPTGPESTLTFTPTEGQCEVRLNAFTSEGLPPQVQLLVTTDGGTQGDSAAPDTATGTELRQWASAATASSQYSDPAWSAFQATGKPDTRSCGDINTAWASATRSEVATLELTYPIAVIPTEVNIYQTYNPGAIVAVTLISAAGEAIDLPNSADPGTACPGVFSLPITLDDLPLITGVRLTLDQSITGDWNEIDAVELVGVTPEP